MKIGRKIIYQSIFLLTAIYFILILSLFTRSYAVNDNIAIIDNIRYNCIVPFMSVLLGYLLSFCYLTISDHIPWYGLCLYVSLAISMFLILCSLLKIKKLGYLRIPFVFLFMILYCPMVMKVGYNGASIMAGISSLFTLMVYLQYKDKKYYTLILLLGVHFAFTYLIRTNGLKAVLVFSAPVLLICAFVNLKMNYRYYLIFALPLLIAISTSMLLQMSMENPRYSQYQNWNKLRGQFHNFPVEYINRNNGNILKANNWTENDYDLLTKWIFLDENKYNIETFK